MLQYLSFGIFLSRFSLAKEAYLAMGIPQYHSVINAIKLASLYGMMPVAFYLYGLNGAIAAIARQRKNGVAAVCEPGALSRARTAPKIAFSFEKETPILVFSSICTVHTKTGASVISST